jgi:virginiamycin B lyase
MLLAVARVGSTQVSFTEYPVPTTGSSPWGIAAGPDGALWFTDLAGNIGRITTSGGFTEYAVPTAGSSPSDIAAGPDGALWFTEPGGNKIGRITLTTTTVPTLSTWGLILLAMLTVAAGTLQLRRYSSR